MVRLATVTCFLVLSWITTSYADERGKDVEKTIAAICDEADRHPDLVFAGRYQGHFSEDEVTKLWIVPAAGIAYQKFGNDGLNDSNAGSVRIDGDEITIAWRHSVKHPHHPEVASTLLIVTWGQTTFLVPKGSIHRFCLDAKENSHPQLLRDFRKVNESSPLPTGSPKLPKGFEEFANLQEIVATVTAVAKPIHEVLDNQTKRTKQTVTINKGSADHIYVGMELDCQEKLSQGRSVYERFTVSEVKEHSSTAINAMVSRPVKEGWTLKTAR